MEKGQEVKYRVWCDHACHSGYETHTGVILEIGETTVRVQSNGQTYTVKKESITAGGE